MIPDHKCFQLHGHSFKVRIFIEGPLNNMGWVMDFSDLKNICNKLDIDYQSYILNWHEFKDIQLSILKSSINEPSGATA